MSKTKNLDDKDVIFIDQPWSQEERKQFSLFLKTRKIKRSFFKKVKTRKHSQ